MKNETIFTKLFDTNVNDHIDKKSVGKGRELSYLSWAWAWAQFKQAVPDAVYEIKHWDGKPYLYDEVLGYMVETSITANNETHTMWLPVMDGANNAMKSYPYEYKTKYETKTVDAATMFDINTAIMRCLVKNMAMFGLGLYIYAGEDLPATEKEAQVQADLMKKIEARQKKIQSIIDTLPADHKNKWQDDYMDINISDPDAIKKLDDFGVRLTKFATKGE